MDINGYPIIYMPEHHMQIGNSGCVYEHVLVAEKILGRQLNKLEVVHHKDKNRHNNSPDNLIVFKTKSDHTRYHNTGIMEKCGDVYISPKQYNRCIDCGTVIDRKAKRCVNCYNKFMNSNSNKPDKNTLEELIHTISFVQIGKMFNVSDNTIRKWCKSYGLTYRSKDIKNTHHVLSMTINCF